MTARIELVSVELVSVDTAASFSATASVIATDAVSTYSSSPELVSSDYLAILAIMWLDIPSVAYADLPFQTRRRRS